MERLDNMMRDYAKDKEQHQNNLFRNAPTFIRMMARRAHESLQSDVTQQLMQSEQKFDLLDLGRFFNDFQLVLAGHFQYPSVERPFRNFQNRNIRKQLSSHL